MRFLQSCLNGEARLWKVWWLLFVLPLLILTLVNMVNYLPSITILNRSMAVTTITSVIQVVISLFIPFSVWRCSNNCQWQGWGTIVRLLLVPFHFLAGLYALLVVTLLARNRASYLLTITPLYRTMVIICFIGVTVLFICYLVNIYLKHKDAENPLSIKLNWYIIPLLLSLTHVLNDATVFYSHAINAKKLEQISQTQQQAYQQRDGSNFS